jgi:hypothetical protein
VIRFRDIKDPIPLLTAPVGVRTGWEGFDEGEESHINLKTLQKKKLLPM